MRDLNMDPTFFHLCSCMDTQKRIPNFGISLGSSCSYLGSWSTDGVGTAYLLLGLKTL